MSKKNRQKNPPSGNAAPRTMPSVQSGNMASPYASRWPLIHMGLLSVIFLFIYLQIYTNNIDLNGDNIWYYILGKALASGKGYVDLTSPALNPQNHFPPGYPFLTSLFMRAGFEDASFYNGLNGFLALATILVFYAFLNRTGINRRLSFAICLFITFNPAILIYSRTNMSEVPYLFFSISAMYILAGMKFEKAFFSDYRFWLLLVCLVMSYYIRTAGIALIIAAVFYMAFRKKWVYAGATAIAFILCIIPWSIRSSRLGGSDYMLQFGMKNPYRPELGTAHFSDFLERIMNNLSRYISLEIPSALLSYPDIAYEDPSFSDWIMGLILLGLIVYALARLWKTQPALTAYLLASGGILLLWPEVWRGVRFMVPVIPFLIMLCVYGINDAAGYFGRKAGTGWNPLILCIGVLFMIAPVRRLHADATEPYPSNFQNYFNIAQWARENLPDTSVISCRKPELFYIFSGLSSVKYIFTEDDKLLLSDLEKEKVDFVVIDQLGFSSTGRYLVPAVQKNPDRFEVIYQQKNPDTYLLRFKHNE